MPIPSDARVAQTICMSTAPQQKRSDMRKTRYQNQHRASIRAIQHAPSDESIVRAHAKISSSTAHASKQPPFWVRFFGRSLWSTPPARNHEPEACNIPCACRTKRGSNPPEVRNLLRLPRKTYDNSNNGHGAQVEVDLLVKAKCYHTFARACAVKTNIDIPGELLCETADAKLLPLMRILSNQAFGKYRKTPLSKNPIVWTHCLGSWSWNIHDMTTVKVVANPARDPPTQLGSTRDRTHQLLDVSIEGKRLCHGCKSTANTRCVFSYQALIGLSLSQTGPHIFPSILLPKNIVSFLAVLTLTGCRAVI